MGSSFGWLDNDDEQRQHMLKVVDLFKEQGTIDELGVGSIRDTLANALFPGTSTLHTRLRYALFVPWLLRRAAQGGTAAQMERAFEVSEYQLIESLLKAGENNGVIGIAARSNLKRLPSEVYWSAINHWGIIDAGSAQAYFRRHLDIRALVRRESATDGDEPAHHLVAHAMNPGFPPEPHGLLRQVSFDLSGPEESYLSERITASTKGTLLAWLVTHPPANIAVEDGPDAARYAWEIANLDDAPQEIASLVEHARRFSLLMRGASLVYNAALARHGNRDEVRDEHELSLEQWHATESPQQMAASWGRADWWAHIENRNPRLNPRTRNFVDAWVDEVASGGARDGTGNAARLVEHRERQIKGARARFVNQGALDRWSGNSGLSQLDFRWRVARSHLRDLYRARVAA